MSQNKLILLILPILLVATSWWFYSTQSGQDGEYDPELDYVFALQLIQQNKLEEAKKRLEKCIDKDPTNGKYDFALGNIYRKQNELEKSLAFYENSIKKSPEIKEAYNNVAAIKMLENKLDDARAAVDQGLKIDPDFKDLKFKKAQLHYLKENFKQTIEIMDWLKSDSEYYEAFRFLGLSYLKLNDNEKALTSLKQYLDKAPADLKGRADIQKIVVELETYISSKPKG